MQLHVTLVTSFYLLILFPLVKQKLTVFISWVCLEEVPRVWCWGAPLCTSIWGFLHCWLILGQKETGMKGYCCGQLSNGVYSTPYRAQGIKIGTAHLVEHFHPHHPQPSSPSFCSALLPQRL